MIRLYNIINYYEIIKMKFHYNFVEFELELLLNQKLLLIILIPNFDKKKKKIFMNDILWFREIIKIQF